MSNQLQPRAPITIDLRPQSTQPAPRPVWQMQAAPDEYKPSSFPAHGSPSDKLEWLCGHGLVMMLAALIVTAFAVALCAMFLLLPVLLLLRG